MTGAEHYREAERLLTSSHPGAVAIAQVHATLAVAAGIAVPYAGGLCATDRDAWQDAAGNGSAWHEQPPGGGDGE